jgi:hypothetical protein
MFQKFCLKNTAVQYFVWPPFEWPSKIMSNTFSYMGTALYEPLHNQCKQWLLFCSLVCSKVKIYFSVLIK